MSSTAVSSRDDAKGVTVPADATGTMPMVACPEAVVEWNVEWKKGCSAAVEWKKDCSEP